MNINYLQSRLNRLKADKRNLRKEMDKAYDLYLKEPTDDNLEAFDALRRKHNLVNDSLNRVRHKLDKARGIIC